MLYPKSYIRDHDPMKVHSLDDWFNTIWSLPHKREHRATIEQNKGDGLGIPLEH